MSTPSLVSSIATPPAASPGYPREQTAETSVSIDAMFTEAELGFMEELLIYVEQQTPVFRESPEQMAILLSCKAKLGAARPQ